MSCFKKKIKWKNYFLSIKSTLSSVDFSHHSQFLETLLLRLSLENIPWKYKLLPIPIKCFFSNTFHFIFMYNGLIQNTCLFVWVKRPRFYFNFCLIYYLKITQLNFKKSLIFKSLRLKIELTIPAFQNYNFRAFVDVCGFYVFKT